MKTKLPTLWQVFLLFFILFNTCLFAQVGINTTTPNGILDVNSSTQGIVLPRIALTSTLLAAPVQNPQGGAILPGTVVYNTANVAGSNGVYPGMYVWTGTVWYPAIRKIQTEIFKQTTMLQPAASAGAQNIPNLTGQSFKANYTGLYKIEVSVNFGAGWALDLAPQADVLPQMGDFAFTFKGNTYTIPAKSIGDIIPGQQQYYAIWKQTFIVKTANLTAGTSYPFSLTFDMGDSPGFIDNGNSGTGLGYIGIPDHVPCSVEFTYIGN